MNYQQMRKAHQERVDSLPFIYAFSQKQLDDALAKRGRTVESLEPKELISFGAGCFVLRKDKDTVLDTLEELHNETDTAMSEYSFAKDAFIDEMGNHEYQINMYQGDWDVISVFWNVEFDERYTGEDYLKQLGKPSEVVKAYSDARDEYYRLCDENDWW